MRQLKGLLQSRGFRVSMLGLVLCCGLLLWARLKLVTQTPRMVYADPESSSPERSTPADPGR